MLSAAWRALADEIALWRDAGSMVEFWWRDDDAARPAPALARLLALSANTSIPLALAVVPLGADAALLAGLLGVQFMIAPLISIGGVAPDFVMVGIVLSIQRTRIARVA